MIFLKTLVVSIPMILFLVGCGGKMGDSVSISPFVQEREFFQDGSLYAREGQVIVLYLEAVVDPNPPAEDTGGVGTDIVKVMLSEKTGHEFRLDVPAGELFTMTVTGPDGAFVAFLDKNTPTATVDVVDGIYTLTVTHGGGSAASRALFIRPGSTINSIDCPDCDLSGVNLKNYNLSNADLSGADLSFANLEYADMTGAVYTGANLDSAILTGMKGMYPAPVAVNGACAAGAVNCYTVYPAQDSWTAPGGLSGTDYAQISFYQCDADGTNVSNNGTLVGHDSDNPVSVTLPADTYWQVTVQNSFDLVPFTSYIQTTNSTTWTYANGCDSSKPTKTGTLCGGSSLVATTGNQYPPGSVGSQIRTQLPPQDDSQITFNRIYLLDQMNGNYLYRGPKPTVKDSSGKLSFDYSDLLSGLKQRFKEQMPKGSVFPSKFKLIDISLINDDAEGPILQTEYEFFGGDNSTQPVLHQSQPINGAFHTIEAGVQGQFWWWNIQAKVGGAESSDIAGLANKISGWMNEDKTGEGDIPYVIYFHCASGTDRTGEIAISYLLTNRKMATSDAYIYGSTIFELAGTSWNRSRLLPNKDYRIGAAWYNCTVCNDNSTLCGNLVSACPTELSSCADCKAATTGCDALKCWDFSSSNAIPGSTKHPNEYPWSTTATWGAACP